MTTETSERRIASDVPLGIGRFGHREMFQRSHLDQQDVVDFLDSMRGVNGTRVETDPNTKVRIEGDHATISPGKGKRTVMVEADHLPDLFSFIKLAPETASKLKDTTRNLVATELLRDREAFTMLVEDGKLQGFGKLTKNVPAIRPSVAVNNMQKATGHEGGEWVRAEEIRPGVAHLELMSYRAHELGYVGDGKVGDTVYAGADILLSPPGLANPEVDSYTLVRVCGNGSCDIGMHMAYRYGNDGDDVWGWFRASVRNAIKHSALTVEVMRKLAEDNIEPDQRAPVIEALILEAGFKAGSPEADSIRAKALESDIKNGFDAHQVLTWATSHLNLDGGFRYKAQRKLSQVASDGIIHNMVCPTCHTRQSRKTRGMVIDVDPLSVTRSDN